MRIRAICLSAVCVLIPAASAQAQTKYFARTVLRPVASASPGIPAKGSCDVRAEYWPGDRLGDYIDEVRTIPEAVALCVASRVPSCLVFYSGQQSYFVGSHQSSPPKPYGPSSEQHYLGTGQVLYGLCNP